MGELVKEVKMSCLWEVNWEEGYDERCYSCQLEALTIDDCIKLFRFLCEKRGWNPRSSTVRYENRGDVLYLVEYDKSWSGVMERVARHRSEVLTATLKLQEERNKLYEMQKEMCETLRQITSLMKEERK